MVYLNKFQIEKVVTYLASFPQLTKTAQEELLDHLCSTIEAEMAKGESFDAAFAICRGRWNDHEVNKIISSTKKHFPMLKLAFWGLLVAVFASSPFISVPEPEQSAMLVTIEPPAIYPLANTYRMTAGFGPSYHPITKKERMHHGVDWSAPLGTPILAAGSGKVLEAGSKGNYGNYILLAHDEIYETFYAHLQSLDVQAGDVVSQGQQIGRVGSTGLSTGPHLHYEVFKNGQRVNPADYLP